MARMLPFLPVVLVPQLIALAVFISLPRLARPRRGINVATSNDARPSDLEEKMHVSFCWEPDRQIMHF